MSNATASLEPTHESCGLRRESCPQLSLIVPAYNEEPTIGELLRRVLELPLSLEVIVVDDGSTDQTAEVAETSARMDGRVRLLRHTENQGKGAAIRTGLSLVSGELVVIQDADLETDPKDLLRMVAAFRDPSVQVVYGSRWLGASWRQRACCSYMASWILSFVTNVLYGGHLTDEPTCYKMFRAGVLKKLNPRASGFEFCPEVTAKLLIGGYSIIEVPISYLARTRSQGKKIRARDGLLACWLLLRLRVSPATRPIAIRQCSNSIEDPCLGLTPT